MNEQILKIKTAQGEMETFIVHPSDKGPFPVVILYMDVWGIREELLDIARKIAVVGYYCVLPDFYYRQGRVRNAFRNDKNEMISVDRLNPEQTKIVLTPLSKLTDDMVISDTSALINFIDRDFHAIKGAIGAIGYCMGGRHVMQVMGAFPDRFKACASLHGSLIVTDEMDSPHLSALKNTGELYCGLAEKDRHAQPEKVKALINTPWNLQFQYQLHLGAAHGYALPDRDVHDKKAANTDWEIIFKMFKRQLSH